LLKKPDEVVMMPPSEWAAVVMTMTQVDNIFEFSGWSLPQLQQIPSSWHDWLLCPGSLTARLRAYHPAFSLQLLCEQPGELPAALAARWQQERGIKREVLLLLAGQPCVFAQSWLPLSTIAALEPLSQLGNQPLGEVIFQQADLQRSAIEVAYFDQGLQLMTADAVTGPCWARRSYFAVQQHELLVQEVFLSTLDT
jgi:chorismate--pyruvate lyase